MADAKSPLVRLSDTWPKDTSLHVLVGNPRYAHALRQSLEHVTPTLREVAHDLKGNYRTLQSYAAMERAAPPESGELLPKYLRYLIHSLRACADYLAPLLDAEA